MGRILPLCLVVAWTLAACAGPEARTRGPGERSFEFRYTVEIPQDLGNRSGLRLWLPAPLRSGAQEVERISAPHGVQHTGPDRYGNRYEYLEAPPAGELVWVWRIHRYPDGPGVTGRKLGEVDFLAPNRLVPVTGVAAVRAAEASAGKRGSSAVARALYDRVRADMQYKKEGSGWGRGSTEWACEAGYGNCTDFHAYFISMSRAERIPARFTIGFPIPCERPSGPLSGYHCWAHWFDPQRGWTPVDISEADKHPERAEFFFGHLDPDRVAVSIGRDLELIPPQDGPPLNYMVQAYAELDGVAVPLLTRASFRR